MGASFAPESDVLSVCPHCWEVNHRAFRLCGRCGADMHTVLQESGGARRTTPIQSPVPVRVRLNPTQRTLLFVSLLALLLSQFLTALFTPLPIP
jgi:predicted amidophosphoribosyltransferase